LGNTEENCKMIWKIWKKCEMIWKIWKKGKLNSEKIGKIWKKPVSRAAVAAATTTSATTAAAAATRLLENPVEATTIVQNFVLLLVENVV
jgi:hypothetical protein